MYKITAGDNSTDLGVVGSSATLLGAKRIGRKAVREQLANGQGSYKVFDRLGREVKGEECSIRTGRKWVLA